MIGGEYKFSQEELDEIYYSLQLYNTSLLKYCYILEAHKWIFFSKVETSKESVKSLEIQLLNTVVKSLFEKNYLDPSKKSNTTLSIVDLGVGDAQNIIQILKCMDFYVKNYKFKNFLNSCNLYLIDISSEMLTFAKNSVESKFPLIDLKTLHLDFNSNAINNIEKYFSVENSDKRWFFLLGSTLGNFTHQVTLLKNISSIMKKNDSLIIGVELYQEESLEQTIAHYKTIENYNFDIALLKYLGFKDEDGKFEIIFENRTIISKIKFLNDVRLTVNDKFLTFKRGDLVTLCKSKKFTQEELVKICQESRLKVENIHLGKFKNSSSANYCLLEVSLK